MTLLSTHDLTLSVDNRILCHNININFNRGESWGILGCNGSGKTTLLHTLAGLLKPQSGDIYFQQQLLNKISLKEKAKNIALLLQHYDDNFPSTVLEAVLIGRHPHVKPWSFESDSDLEIAHNALKQLDMLHLKNRDLKSLSGGERRRVAIAALLTQQPLIYLLDEPTNHLDIKYQHQLLRGLKQLSQVKQNLVIMALHDINQATHYCDNIILLLDNAYMSGKKEDILTEENLEKAFNHPLKKLAINNKTVWLAY